MTKKIHERESGYEPGGAEAGRDRACRGVVLDFPPLYRQRLEESICAKRRALSSARLGAIASIMRVVDRLDGDAVPVNRETAQALLKALRKSLLLIEAGTRTVAGATPEDTRALEDALVRIDAALDAMGETGASSSRR